jgi:hypothetical protein
MLVTAVGYRPTSTKVHSRTFLSSILHKPVHTGAREVLARTVAATVRLEADVDYDNGICALQR